MFSEALSFCRLEFRTLTHKLTRTWITQENITDVYQTENITDVSGVERSTCLARVIEQYVEEYPFGKLRILHVSECLLLMEYYILRCSVDEKRSDS